MLFKLLAIVFAIVGLSFLIACNQEQVSTSQTTASIELGSTLYTQYCLSCHGGATGGKITDIPPPHNANGHTWHHPDQQLTNIVLNGLDASVDDQKMPAFEDKLSLEDVQNILAFIKTWWAPEQRAFQSTATKQESDYEATATKESGK